MSVDSNSTGAGEIHLLVIRGDRIYMSNAGPGSVSVLDGKGRKNRAIIKASSSPTQRITISPDDG
jgi:YVTN family beta-propeller protein